MGAFIDFDSEDALVKALEFNDTALGRDVLLVRKASDKPAKGGGKGATQDEKPRWKKSLEVFVAGLPYSMSKDDVEKYFSECGEIVALRMPAASEGRHRGIAFICFTCKEECV